ncbi:MAG: cyclopropane fatty acyl phospholipid synthase [Ginsengibacter sp.]
MHSQSAKYRVIELLSIAGITVNGSAPWDIQVHNDIFYKRVLAGGSLALGESYMERWWDCQKPDEFFSHLLGTELEQKIKSPKVIAGIALTKILNFQTRSLALNNVHRHYDIGNDLFSKMLGTGMVYTCGYWNNVASLDEAQEIKMDLACRKLKLQPGMRILDVGCGWGSFAKFAAEKYQVSVTGISISDEQIKFAKTLCEGLLVEIKHMDYRELNQKFDRIVCFGMFEHVGQKNHRTYMRVVNKCLKDDGLFLLQTIGNAYTRTHPDPWLHKYIFPNYAIPSITQMGKAIEGIFLIEDLHNFGPDYDRTLMAWHENFTNRWNELKDDYDEKFYRMWTYYLLLCAGGFRAKRNFLWQIVFSKRSRLDKYTSVR